ncbi:MULTISPECIES: hypothetical protein [unclassified Thioalkalivibrio]|uniref:hypothetical protein n=1 Tax=unclassified Thioalkalivibrio TaxID=2621013 RepID=UPI0009DA68D1|nr:MULTISPECIES: hypothetical protein [unclassified Thioalkalivibrio]
MPERAENEKIKKAEPEYHLSDFLESHPPNQVSRISKLAQKEYRSEYGGWVDEFIAPQIQLHCSSESCNGERFFRYVDQNKPVITSGDFSFFYATYRCYNCLKEEKTFSLAAKMDSTFSETGECYKFGELPNFGPPTPSRLIKLIGPDRDEFLKGRRCENQGLGVGAFIYYRRVVENQKNRILSEIIKVSEKIGASQEQIKTLKDATEETQFSTALKNAKDAIPESLLINGHSPLLLLHSALSEGIHALSDEECLDIASSVRVVLAELSDRLSQALKDEAALAKALGTLMSYKK